MEFERLISRPGEVMDIFKNVIKSWKMDIHHKKLTFWLNIKCDILGSILMHTQQAPCMSKVRYYKIIEFSYLTMEKPWNLLDQNEPWLQLNKTVEHFAMQLFMHWD